MHTHTCTRIQACIIPYSRTLIWQFGNFFKGHQISFIHNHIHSLTHTHTLTHTGCLNPPTSPPSFASAAETSPRSRATTNNLTLWKNQPPSKTAPPFAEQKAWKYSQPIAVRAHRFASHTVETPSHPWDSTHSASALAASHQTWSSLRENLATMAPWLWGMCTLTFRLISECHSYRPVQLVLGQLRLMLHIVHLSTTMKIAPSSHLWQWEWSVIAMDHRVSRGCTGAAMRMWRVVCQTDSNSSCSRLAMEHKKTWKKYRGRVCVCMWEWERERERERERGEV